MPRRNRASLQSADPSSDEPVSAIERRLELLEGAKKVVPLHDIFDEEELRPMEAVRFDEQRIDPNVVRRLAAMGSDDDEIAEAFALKPEQIRNLFGDQLRQGRAQGKTALRRKQWQVAMKGNVPMLLHLGKNVLGQNDTTNVNVTGKIDVEHSDAKQKLLDLINEASMRLRGINLADEIPMPRLATPINDI